jgi:hypothetical protein
MNWQELRFGSAPIPAFGCIEGVCQVEKFSYQVKPLPPRPAGVVQASAPVRVETPRTVAPAPVKRPAPKPAPAPKGKRK